MTDLVKRLRSVDWCYQDPADGRGYFSDDPHEAADRIEALSAENERLRGVLREAEVKLTDVQGAYATKQYSANLLTRIRAALAGDSHD